ncbi:hypothetical protein CY34DRAFT_612409 [Suillus luteus UH-Slu-Lm8-n1]|uniref:Uncharacterized protein n=1 Tax=Suillus luteus UH-Slu-Lm8-n1 TaxID=930992 RepID=A0A0C9ZZA6_9AGAM|nr:hypothetical protein CY34DRAFT_612409 [Suillus luteus UH-Slu-Lm8-n1]
MYLDFELGGGDTCSSSKHQLGIYMKRLTYIHQQGFLNQQEDAQNPNGLANGRTAARLMFLAQRWDNSDIAIVALTCG